MAKLFSVLLLIISIAGGPGPLAAQTRDDIQAVWETSRQPSRSTPGADRRSASIAGAAAAFRQVRVNTSDLITDMRAVDLNKDGIMDIAILDNQNKRVLVYLGDKALAFSKKYKYGFANAGYYFVAVADFDKSGKPDLAVENVTTTKPVSIFFGKGNGLPDILVQDFTNQLFSFLNQGKKKFSAKNFKPGVGLGFAGGDDPRKSTFLQFLVKIDLPVNDIYVTYSVTGSFLDGLNPDSGTITFNLQLPSPVTVISGTPPDLSLLNFYLYDFNLVRSNSLQ